MTVVATKDSRKVVSNIFFVNPISFNQYVESSTHIKVYADVVLMSVGTHYSISGVGDLAGIEVTISAAGLALAPDNWVVEHDPLIDQNAALSVGGTFGGVYEDAIDALTRRIQALSNKVDRAVKVRVDSEKEYDLPVPQSGSVIGWGADVLENKTAVPTGTELLPVAANRFIKRNAAGTAFDAVSLEGSTNLSTLAGFSPLKSGLKTFLGVPFVSVTADHAAVADAVSVTATVSITSGAAALTAAGAAFTAADVGKSISIPGAGAAGAALRTTISAFTDATNVTLAANAGTTLAAVSKTIIYGTDNETAFQAAISAVLALGGGLIYVPRGVYFFDANAGYASLDPGAGNITFLGDGNDASVLLYDEGVGSYVTQPTTARVLFKNVDDTAKGRLKFESIGFKGTWRHDKRNAGGPSMWLDFYESVEIHDCRFESISLIAFDLHYLSHFECDGSWFEDVARDCIRCRDTPNCIVTNNYILRNGDDAIALHTSNNAFGAGVPTREGIIVANNHLVNAGIIKVIAGRNLKIVNNVQDFPNISGIQVVYDATEGNLNVFDIQITDNTINNHIFVTSAVPTNTGSAIVVKSRAAKGAASTNNFIPGRYDTVAADFIYPWDHSDDQTDLAANPAANMAGIIIARNKLRRTAPSVAAFSDYGFGSILRTGSEFDPAIADADIRQAVGINIQEGGLHSAIITGNIIEHYTNSISMAAPTNDMDYLNVLVAQNVLRDFTSRGVIMTSAAFSADVTFADNTLDGDIYRKSSNSNIDGTYDADSVPEGFNTGSIDGLKFLRNSFKNVCEAIQTNVATACIIKDNVLFVGTIVAIGFNAGNRGIGVLVQASDNFRYVIVDADPTSATYMAVQNVQYGEATAQPASGVWVRGAFVKNTTPSLDASNLAILGWLRLTTGSAHVAGTDWAVCRVSHVSPAT